MFETSKQAAQRLLSDTADLVSQGENECQRSIASLQLLLRQLEVAVESREVTDSMVEAINKAAVEIKHDLRDALSGLASAEDELNTLHGALLGLG